MGPVLRRPGHRARLLRGPEAGLSEVNGSNSYLTACKVTASLAVTVKSSVVRGSDCPILGETRGSKENFSRRDGVDTVLARL